MSVILFVEVQNVGRVIRLSLDRRETKLFKEVVK